MNPSWLASAVLMLSAVFQSVHAVPPRVALPATCKAELDKQHPGWQIYEMSADFAKKRPYGHEPSLVVSDDFDADKKPDVAAVITFRFEPMKQTRIFVCLSSSGDKPIAVGFPASGDSAYEIELIDNTRPNYKGEQTRLGKPPEKGFVWRHNSYAGFDFWYEHETFVKGDMFAGC